MATFRTFFPIVRQAKRQLTGDAPTKFEVAEKKAANKRKAPVWDKPIPEYKTQAEVTAAIANGTFKGNSIKAYDDAKAYEKYLKLLAQFEAGFKPMAAKPRANGSYNFTMQFGK
jgi:hypothetical protein